MKNCPTCQTSYPNNFVVCPQDGVALVEVGPWSEGSVIRGKYRIVCKVGQGGMGAVYKVVHVAFDELHALKVINQSLMSDELFVKRFKHEAVITRRLQHPNAVRVDDIDEAEDGRPIIVMEYIEGQSLKKLIQDQGALPYPRVCAIIKQAAAALDAAHKLEMVHRDIKPDNIVLISTPDGEQAKVLDFGIAKIKEARSSDTAGMTLTGTGVVIGTPQYMSPEQAMGKRGDELDGRSDIYSLGVVMYQMLTGDLPFKADTTMGMLIAHMQTPPTSIRAIHPELQIPDAIANVVMRTLEKNPDLRPSSALALITEIENAEKWTPPLNATRVMDPRAYSPEESARALRVALQTPRKGQVRETPPIAEVTPKPAAPMEPSLPPPMPPRASPAPVKLEPAIPPRPMAAAAPPKKSTAALWATICVLTVVLVGGGVYIIQRNSSAPPANLDTDSNKISHSSGSPEIPPVRKTGQDALSERTQQQTEHDAIKPPLNDGDTQIPRTSKKQTQSVIEKSKKDQIAERRPPVTPEITNPAKSTVDPIKVAGAIKLGDFYFDRGEYDNAINEFQRGLNLDPSNSTLRSKLDRAKKAKAAESRVLQ